MTEPEVVDLGLHRLVHLEQRIVAREGDNITDRWEFGHELLTRRVGKQLPKGLLDEVCAAAGVSRREVQYRVRFAEQFPTPEEVCNAVAHFGSWHAVVNDALAASPKAGPAGPAALAPPAEGLHRTIVADPPWQYGNTSTRGAAEDHYPTMTIEELCALPVEARADEQAHLYLWTTNGFLREAFDVVDAWGFTYKTCLTWVKPQMGMGNYFRSSTEHILFATRGNLGTHENNIVNWFEAKRGKHSAKPLAFYDMVAKASPGPYLEMFARCWRDQQMFCHCSKCRLGWSTWGNQS